MHTQLFDTMNESDEIMIIVLVIILVRKGKRKFNLNDIQTQQLK